MTKLTQEQEKRARQIASKPAAIEYEEVIAGLVDALDEERAGGDSLNYAQHLALVTAIYPGQRTPMGFVYAALGANGEAGEIAEHAKKMLRDDAGVITDERREKIKKEIGDLFWYVCACADEVGFTLQEIADKNRTKLRDRAAAGTLQGSGSDR